MTGVILLMLVFFLAFVVYPSVTAMNVLYALRTDSSLSRVDVSFCALMFVACTVFPAWNLHMVLTVLEMLLCAPAYN